MLRPQALRFGVFFVSGCPNIVPPSDGAAAPPLWAGAGAGMAASSKPAACRMSSRCRYPRRFGAPARSRQSWEGSCGVMWRACGP